MAPVNSVLVKKKRRQLKPGPQHLTSIVKKSTQTSGARKSLRLQNKPVSHIPQPKPAQPFLTPLAPISQPARTKRKRSRDSEVEPNEPKEGHPAKRPRRSSPPSLEPSEEKLAKDSEAEAKAEGPKGHLEQPQEPPLLSEKDSYLLQSLYKDVMDSASNKSLKRTSSRRSIVQSESGSYETQRSSSTNAIYRRQNLAAVKIRLHAEPPDDIETAIKNIVNAEFSEQCRAEFDIVAREFRDGCLKNVRAQSGEDDCIDPLHTAIKALHLKNLCIHEKAAWRSELKPVIPQQPHFSSKFMAGIQQPEVNGTSASPPKRQQQYINGCISPESSMTNAITPSASNSQESSTMPPPALVIEKKDRSPVKTPHPDLSIGIDLGALVSALSSQDLDEDKATGFIDWLQKEMVQYEPGGSLEPMLILVPAPHALDLAFPFAVVEGKAYSTGKQIFEAENQAAGALACAHNILHRLDCMANRGKATNTPPRVLFSITTQGPIHELWAHWTVVKSGVRIFESKLWDSWNALLPERAVDFIVKLNNVCVWGTGLFMKSVVEGLGKVAVQAET